MIDRTRWTKREQFRTDFCDQFLSDAAMHWANHGQDPRNCIGINCGVSPPRVLQRHHDRWLESVHE
jgi:hypothetical protein